MRTTRSSGVGLLTSILRRAEVASRVARMPCCNASYPELNRIGRCAWYADGGLCDKFGPSCPVACDGCAVCHGHPQRKLYVGMWRKMRHPPLAASAALSSARERGQEESLGSAASARSATGAMRHAAIFSPVSEMKGADAWGTHT